MHISRVLFIREIAADHLCMVCSKTRRRVFVSFYCDFQFRTEDYLLTRDRWLQRGRGCGVTTIARQFLLRVIVEGRVGEVLQRIGWFG